MDRFASPVLFGFGGVSAAGPGGRVDLGGPKPRGLLGLLLVQPGVVVSVDRIVERIWAGAAPPKADVSVRGYVSNLRKALAAAGLDGGQVIASRGHGYSLEVRPEVIDLHLFDALVDDGVQFSKVNEHERVRQLLVRALELWAGPPLGATGEELGLTDVIAWYTERRGQAVELLADARLALGEHAQMPAWLATEISREPYREGLRARLALALYRAGRPVDALRSLEEARRRLGDDVGVEPGPELRKLESAILSHDDATLSWTPPAAGQGVDGTPDAIASTVTSLATPPMLNLDDEIRFGRRDEEEQIAVVLDRLPVRGGVLIISGEAGIGKSSLLRGLCVEAERRGIVVGRDRCPESAAGAPYRSWWSAIGALQYPGGIVTDADGPEQEAATALLRTHLSELDRLRSRRAPAVVVIDDLQWADDATLSLLKFLGPEFERLRILLAVGVRRSGLGELPPPVLDCVVELARSSDAVDLRLGLLGRGAIAKWVETRTGQTGSPALVDYLLDTTSGNPFYLGELLALLESDGHLTAAFTLPAKRAVPGAVQDVVRRRTSRLPPSTQALLTSAAVIGRRFDLDVLAYVLEIDTADALTRLEPALNDAIIFADPEPGRFSFSHALVSEALMNELNPARLAERHARVTDALEALHADDLEPWVEDLAHHAAEGLLAGTAPKSLTYALRAAATAETKQSAADLAVQLRRALAASERVPGFPREQRRGLLLRLGMSLPRSR